jgi:plastocyanin
MRALGTSRRWVRIAASSKPPRLRPPRDAMSTRMNKPALLLSLLALAALGLVACGGDDDDQTTATSETETSIDSVVKAERQITRAQERSGERNRAAAARDRRLVDADGDHRVKLYTEYGELAFEPRFHRHGDTATAEAGALTIVWKNGSDTLHNICMADEQGKPVFKKVVFNGGRERSAESTPRCSKTIRGRTLRARAKVKPGEYTYYCSVGRHRERGMEGTLTVK